MSIVYVTSQQFDMSDKTIYAGVSLEEAFNAIEKEGKDWLEYCRVDVWEDGKEVYRYYWSFDYNKFMVFTRDKIQGRATESYTIAPKDNEHPLQDGDKLRRKGDGKLFTFVEDDDFDDEPYGRVKEMAVPVYLPDFVKAEDTNDDPLDDLLSMGIEEVTDLVQTSYLSYMEDEGWSSDVAKVKALEDVTLWYFGNKEKEVELRNNVDKMIKESEEI